MRKTTSNDNKTQKSPKVSIYVNTKKAHGDLLSCATESQLITWVKKYKTHHVKKVISKGLEITLKNQKKDGKKA